MSSNLYLCDDLYKIGNGVADYIGLPPTAYLRTLPLHIYCYFVDDKNATLVDDIIIRSLLFHIAVKDLKVAFEVKHNANMAQQMGYDSYDQACKAIVKLNDFTDLLVDKNVDVNETIEQFTKNTEE